MKDVKDVFSLSFADFLKYIKTIDYGYTDIQGGRHIGREFDLKQFPYAFSSPAKVIKNNCAWCWDICELIRGYCDENSLPVSTWFYEYMDKECHQTHTQAFVELEKLWYPVPDNSDPHLLEDFRGKAYEEVTKEFQSYFKGFIHHISNGKATEDDCIFREYTGHFKEGMSDEEVLMLLRRG